MIEVLEDMPDGVVGVEAVGEVTTHDDETVLIPTFDAGDRCTGFSSGALWDDRKYGFSHRKGCGSAFSWLSPIGTKVFPTPELDAAESWVAG